MLSVFGKKKQEILGLKMPPTKELLILGDSFTIGDVPCDKRLGLRSYQWVRFFVTISRKLWFWPDSHVFVKEFVFLFPNGEWLDEFRTMPFTV